MKKPVIENEDPGEIKTPGGNRSLSLDELSGVSGGAANPECNGYRWYSACDNCELYSSCDLPIRKSRSIIYT